MLFKRFMWITLAVSLLGVSLAQIIAASHPGIDNQVRFERWQRVEAVEPVCDEQQCALPFVTLYA
ncbi:MAG: hypothetical protein AAFQ10_06985 [Pseudomonadota bacterium]